LVLGELKSNIIVVTSIILILLIVTPSIIRAFSLDSISKDIPASETAKVLVDDVIRDLKSNDTKNAQLHLTILNQQSSLENLTPLNQ
jgi:hypothetical protein